MTAGGRLPIKKIKEKEPPQTYEDMEAQEFSPKKMQKRISKGKLPSLVRDSNQKGDKLNQTTEKSQERASTISDPNEEEYFPN